MKRQFSHASDQILVTDTLSTLLLYVGYLVNERFNFIFLCICHFLYLHTALTPFSLPGIALSLFLFFLFKEFKNSQIATLITTLGTCVVSYMFFNSLTVFALSALWCLRKLNFSYNYPEKLRLLRPLERVKKITKPVIKYTALSYLIYDILTLGAKSPSYAHSIQLIRGAFFSLFALALKLIVFPNSSPFFTICLYFAVVQGFSIFLSSVNAIWNHQYRHSALYQERSYDLPILTSKQAGVISDLTHPFVHFLKAKGLDRIDVKNSESIDLSKTQNRINEVDIPMIFLLLDNKPWLQDHQIKLVYLHELSKVYYRHSHTTELINSLTMAICFLCVYNPIYLGLSFCLRAPILRLTKAITQYQTDQFVTRAILDPQSNLSIQQQQKYIEAYLELLAVKTGLQGYFRSHKMNVISRSLFNFANKNSVFTRLVSILNQTQTLFSPREKQKLLSKYHDIRSWWDYGVLQHLQQVFIKISYYLSFIFTPLQKVSVKLFATPHKSAQINNNKFADMTNTQRKNQLASTTDLQNENPFTLN